jgi:Leucine carboxyl methyltransferase
MNQVIENVSDTAFLVAGFRGMETDRPDPLFRDPLAWTLAGEHGHKIIATVPRRFFGAWSLVIRTVIIDSFIRDAIAGGVDTVLNLGAGLDTRPYRMNLRRGRAASSAAASATSDEGLAQARRPVHVARTPAGPGAPCCLRASRAQVAWRASA